MSIYILYAVYTFTYGTMIAEFLGISFFFWCFCFDMLLQVTHTRKESNSCGINCFLLASLFYKSFSEISLIPSSENLSSMLQISSAAFLWVTIRTVFSVISRRLDNTLFSISSSNALVDSSSIRIGRFAYMARAMAILCICPSEIPVPLSPRNVSRPCGSFLTKSRASAI